MQILPYNHADPAQQRWLFPAWVGQTGEPASTLREGLRAGAKLVIAADPPGEGDVDWLFHAVTGRFAQALVFVYVKAGEGGCMLPKVEQARVLPKLITHLGFDLGQPLPVLFRSPCSDALRHRGLPITYPTSKGSP